MSWRIKGKNGLRKAVIGALEYNDEWMSQTYVTATVISPVPINFEIGDYIEYRGERFEINYDPSKIKSAPRFAKGDAFKYENIKFNSLADELTRCDFLDVVLADNHLHFTGLPKFSFFGTVQDLAGRIQANLDRAYPDKWTVTVSPEYTGKKELNVSIDTQKVWDALSILVNDFETYFTIEGRTITIGAAGVPAAHLFKYGKDNGLYEIEQNAESDQAIVTRLRAYGSTRNLPNRYYNSLSGADGEKLIPNNMAVQHLMLPEFPYTTQDPFIDSKNIDTLGVREGTVFFDGSQEGLEEIYPSIEGMTAEQLKSAGVTCNSTGDLDVLIGANVMTDDGVGKIDKNETQTTPEPSTFKVTVKDLGFDIKDCVIPGNSESPTVSFKTGMLGGREFEIVECTPIENSSGDVTSYMLELNRVYDDDVKLWFPYKDHNAAAGDKFVILNIKMPDVYIKAAAKRLKEAAEAWLAKNDYSRSVYSPKVDEIFMARQHDAAMASGGAIKSLHDTLRAGMLMLFEDEDFNIDASIFIDKLVIKEGEGAIPTYEVTLKEEKTVGRLDKMQNQIDSLASGRGQGGVGGYTAGQIRQMIDAYGDTRFLSKIKDDRTPHTISSDRGFEVGNYVSGAGGGAIGIDPETGESFADVARLWVRVRAFFEELTVVKASVFAGKNYISPGGGIKCTKVEEVKDSGGNVTAYRCYFLSSQDGEKAETQFAVNDQAISETFNAAAGTSNKISNHRYWRLVTAVSNDAYTDDSGNHYGYIDLSATDCEVDSDIPQAGDDICQLGNRNDADRQSAIMFSTVDADAPSVKLFAGVGSGSTNAEHYSLNGKAVIMFGKNPLTGKVYFRLGTSTATHYLDYTQDGGLTVAGKISVLSTITDTSGNESSIDQYITDTANELLVVEYSATGADGTWHSTYTNGDRYMRQSSDGGNTWSGAMLITAQDVTITNQSVEYATSASGTTAPTAGWSTTIPSVAEGQYLWTRTTLTFSDGNSVVSYSVSRQGVDGNSGSDYAPNLLVDSKGPRTITASSSNNTTYMVFNFDPPIEVKSGDKFTVSFGNIEVLAGSPTEFTASLYNISGTGWGTYGSSVHVTKDKPWGTMTVSKSILARHLLVYAGKYGATAGNSVKYTDVMLTKGETPAKWVPAASEMLAPVITSQSVTYAKSTTAAQPSDASFTYSSISAANPARGDYLWTKTVVNYSDGTSTKSYTVSRLGADGSDGTPGAPGADGKTQYTHIAYAQGATGELPHPTAFTKFQTTAFDGAEYIGFRHDFDQLDPLDHTLYEWSKYKGKDGAGYTPNLLKGTQEVTVNNSYAKIGFDEPQDFLNGEKYTVSVEGIENLIGSATEYSVVLFRNAGGDLSNGILCPVVTLTKEKPYATMTLYSTATKENKVELFLYAGKHGSTVGNSVKYTKVMLSKGDNPMPWVPAASEMVGKDAPYTVFQWAKGDYAQPTGTWSDTPLNALPGEFVWMREGVVTPPATTPVWKSGYTRVTGDTGAAGTNYTPNMLTNSKDNKIHVVEKDSDSYKEWRNSTVHLVYKKTYTISARTNAAAFTGDHQDAIVSHPDACALWICSAKGSPQGFVNEVVSSADMATDGSKGSVFTWMKPTAGYFLRTNFYKSGTWYVNHVKIEEGDNPNPSWTPHPDEMVGTPGTNGINGQDVFLLDLDNEMVPVTCDAKGNVISGLPATITARVFKGGTEVTSGVTYGNQGTTLTVSQSGNKFEIKGISKDRDTLVIEAVVAGLTLRSTVTVYKVKPGEDGAPATMYFLESAESSVTRTAQGGLSVTSLGCRKLYVTGSDQRHLTTANTLTAQIYTNGVAGTETVIAADGVTNNGEVTLTDDTTAVVFTLYKGASTAEADMLDRERVPVLTDAFGLSVGGVNLLRKTNSGIINWTTNTSSNGQIVMEPGTPQSRCVFYNNATTAAPDWQMIGFALPADTIKANCYYMLSFKARVLQSNGTAGGALTQPLQLRWQISKNTGGDRLTNVESRTVTYTETRFTIMMRTTGVPTSQHRLWGYISTTGTAWEALEIWDMQLEEGVVATEYKASPLDFNYLTEALKESTTVERGVILSSLMRLGYTASDAYRVTAGMNGVLAPSTDGTDPAIWAGGDMLDATSDENSSADLDSLAKLMFRHNGNGYMCGGVVRVLDGRILIGRNRKADGTIKSDAEFAQDCIILDEEGLTYVSGGQDRLLVTSAQVGDTFETKVNAVNWSGTATAFDSIALAHYYNKIYLLEPVQPGQPASEDDTESQNELPYTEVWSWVPTINIAQTKTINIGSGTIAVGTVIEVSSLSTSFSITRSHSEGVQITATAELCYTDSAGKVQVVRKVNMPKQYSGNTCSFSMGTTIRHTVQVAASYFVRLTLTPNTDGMGKPLANEYKTVTPATATASGTTKTTRSDVTIIGTDGIKSIWGDGGFLANSYGVKIRGSLWVNGQKVTVS